MSRLINVFFIVVTLLFSTTALAKDVVAVVDIDGVVAASSYAKSMREQLENSQSFKQKKARYQALGEELKKLEADAKANGLTWSDDQKTKYNQTAQGKLAEINQIGKQLETEFGVVNQNLAKELTPIIDKIVNAIIKEKKIDVLLNARAVHYANPDNNISKELLDRLNKEKK